MNQIPTAQNPSPETLLPENLLSFLPGEKRALALPPFSLPLTIVHGMHPGKKLLLTAGVHGCEYCSIVAAMELCRELDPKELSGSVVIAPIANMSGFYERLAALVAEDGKNLNRVFPGKGDGSHSERLALEVTKLQDWADFYVDMHGGDLHEAMHPFVFVPGMADAQVTDYAREAAGYLDVDVRVLSKATTGAYNSAAIRGVPSLLIERGGLGVWTRAEVDAYKRDIYSLLHFLGMLPGKAEKGPAAQRELQRVVYLEAKVRGLWFPADDTRPGKSLRAGQFLGEIRDVQGNVVRRYEAEFDAMVLYMTVSLAVKEGTPLVAYG